MTESETRPNLNYASTDMSPLKLEVLDCVNAYEENRNAENSVEIKERMVNALSAFSLNDEGVLENRPWHLLTMEAMVAAATEDFPKAIDLDEQAFAIADTDQKRGVSRVNQSDAHRKLSNFPEAQSLALDAYGYWPSHGGIICMLALARYMNGSHPDTCRRLLKPLLLNCNPSNYGDVVSLHVRFDSDFKRMINDLYGV